MSAVDRRGVTADAAPAARSLGLATVRFLLAGGLSAGLDAALLWLLHGVAGVPLPVATFTAVVSAFAVNFLLNRRWVFAADGPAGAQLTRYLLLAAVNWAVTVAAVSGLAALGLHYLVARILVLVALTVVNFVAYRTWVFRRAGTVRSAEGSVPPARR